MTFIADALLLLAAISAAIYCRILAIRLRALSNMDAGVGGAISTLSEQVDTLKTTLAAVSAGNEESAKRIIVLTTQADAAARRLELLLASLHEPDSEMRLHPSEAGSLRNPLTLTSGDLVHGDVGRKAMQEPAETRDSGSSHSRTKERIL